MRTTAVVLAFGCSGGGVALAQTNASQSAPVQANAQATSAPTDTAPQTGGQVGEVIVTATRRSEPVQKVPIAVTVVTAERMQEDNLNDLRDVSAIVPSLNYRQAASDKDEALALRGLGTVSTSPGVEPSVSTVIDGVVIARQGQAMMDLLDIDQLEVLRGPQGTLFGKNSSAGVLNITTKTPTDQVQRFIDLGYYGGGGEYRGSAGISGPIVPGEVWGSLTGFGAHYNGNVTNVYDDSTVNGYSREGLRGKIVAKPTDKIRVQVIADYEHSEDTTPQGVVSATNLVAYPTGVITNFTPFANDLKPVVAGSDNQQINVDYFTHEIDENWGLSAQVDAELGAFTLTSITAYRHWDNTEYEDETRLAAPFASYPQEHDIGDLHFHQVSEEMRLASPKGGFFDYQVGLFAYQGVDAEVYQRNTIVFGTGGNTAYNGIANYGTTNTSYAAFGEGNLHFTDKLRLTLGLRETHDDLNFHFNRVSTATVSEPGIQTSFVAGGSTSDNGTSARASLQYDFTQRVMGYFTYSRGYKGPAYNVSFSMLPQDTGALKPETSDAYELGFKSRFLDGAALLNVAAFLDKVANYQVNFYDTYNGSPVTRLINAGEVSTRGVEADASWRVTEPLTLSGSFAYTDAHVDDFTCPAGTSASCQINGKPLPLAPKYKGVIRATYLQPVNDQFRVRVTTDVTAQSQVQYSINQTPDTIQAGYGIWNGAVGLLARDGWEVNFLVKNIADKSYSSFLQTFGQGVVRFVPRDDHRYFGVNVHARF